MLYIRLIYWSMILFTGFYLFEQDGLAQTSNYDNTVGTDCDDFINFLQGKIMKVVVVVGSLYILGSGMSQGSGVICFSAFLIFLGGLGIPQLVNRSFTALI